MRLGRLAAGHNIGRNILEYDTAPGSHAVGPDMTELMNHGTATENGMITHGHMPCQGGTVGQNGMISDNTVMGTCT